MALINITICGDNIILNEIYSDYFASHDAGATWSMLSGSAWPKDAGIFIIASKENILLASDYHSNDDPLGSVYLSSDCGSTWKQLSVPSSASAGIIIDNSLIISTSSAVYKSDDLGLSWTKQSLGLSSQSYIGFMISKGNKIIAASASGKIYHTDANSFNWVEVNSNLPKGLGITIDNLIVHNDIIIAVIKGKGIYTSVDDGATWIAQNSGYPENIRIVDIVVLNENLFLVDQSGNIYKSELTF